MKAFLLRLFGYPVPARLTFEIHPDNTVKVTADWPRAKTYEEKANLASRLATAIDLLCRGYLFQQIQRAFWEKGDDVANSALGIVEDIRPREEGPVVKPSEVFSPRRNDGEQD